MMYLHCHGQLLSPITPYISTEHFNHTCYVSEKKKWLCSFPYGLNAIIAACKSLGVDGYLSIHRLSATMGEDSTSELRRLMREGPFMLGPLPVSSLFNRFENRYFEGYAHFVYVFQMTDMYCLAHDPNGCPHFQLSLNTIFNMLKSQPTPVYAIQLTHLDSCAQPPEEQIFRCVLGHAIQNRLELMDTQMAFGTGMKQLADAFALHGIKSSERYAIRYVLIHKGISLQILGSFLQMRECYHVPGIEPALNGLDSLITRYQSTLSALQPLIHEVDDGRIISCLESIWRKEEEMDTFFVKMNEMLGDVL